MADPVGGEHVYGVGHAGGAHGLPCVGHGKQARRFGGGEGKGKGRRRRTHFMPAQPKTNHPMGLGGHGKRQRLLSRIGIVATLAVGKLKLRGTSKTHRISTPKSANAAARPASSPSTRSSKASPLCK